MKTSKLAVGFAGSRWLGVECFRALTERKDVEIKAVCFPKKSDSVWWKDVVDEDEVKKLGYKITPWKKWLNLKFDVTFSVLHGAIFKKEHINSSQYGVINLHPAPLPEYRGCNSYAHAIMNGDKKYRVTLHYVEEEIDTGPIIAQSSLPITFKDTGYTLYQKAQPIALSVFEKNLSKIIAEAKIDRKVYSKKQDGKKSRYYSRDSLKNKEANIKWNATKLYNFVRALDFPPFEPAYVVLKGQKTYLILNQR